MTDLPEDVQPAWLSLIRRLQSVAKSGGLSIITIKVLCNSSGLPVVWLEPHIDRIEPRSKADMILALVAKDSMIE